MNFRGYRLASESGITSVEMVVATAIFASVFLFTLGYLYTIVHRERMKTAVREIYSLTLASRIQAVKRDSNVVLQIDIAKRELTSWADAPPANFVRDASEPILNVYRVPGYVSFRALAGPLEGPNSVAFDGYGGEVSLVDRLVFRPNGSLLPPQAANSRPAARPAAFTLDVPAGSVDCRSVTCRGIFLADRAADGPSRNLFRISVDDFARVGKASLLKWLPPEQGGNSGEWDFVPPPWKWVD
jgi:hypothetical protein